MLRKNSIVTQILTKMKQKRTVVFCPFNSAGHINNLLSIADRLKIDYDAKTVFIIVGQLIIKDVREHGHEIVSIVESRVYEDYVIEECDSLMGPVTEAELERKQFKEKKKFSGPAKWPQFLARHHRAFGLSPIEDCITTIRFFEHLADDMIEYNAEYERVLAELQPDMVVSDMFNVYPAVAKLKNTPWVQVFSPNPYTLLRSKLPGQIKPPWCSGARLWTKEERDRFRQERPEEWKQILDFWRVDDERIRLALENYCTKMEDFHAQQNLESPKLECLRPNLNSPYLNLYVYPKVLDYDKDDDIFEYDTHWLRYDSLIRKPSSGQDAELNREWDEKINRAMVGKKELVLFSFGSLATAQIDMMNRLLGILKTDKQRCYVISMGARGHELKLNPSNMIGDSYLPQTFILQRCNLAIIHGGTNSLTECLYYGVPIIVMPVCLEQFDNAQRLVDLGLGKRLHPRTCSATELIGAIDDVLSDESLIKRYELISEEMRVRDDSRKIIAILKKLMEDGKLDEQFIEECRRKDYEEIKFRSTPTVS